MAESKNVYVKLGERGLIEREASTPRDHINFKATGWVLKGSKNAPTGKPVSELTSTVDVAEVPTSVRAQADTAPKTGPAKS